MVWREISVSERSSLALERWHWRFLMHRYVTSRDNVWVKSARIPESLWANLTIKEENLTCKVELTIIKDNTVFGWQKDCQLLVCNLREDITESFKSVLQDVTTASSLNKHVLKLLRTVSVWPEVCMLLRDSCQSWWFLLFIQLILWHEGTSAGQQRWEEDEGLRQRDKSFSPNRKW